MQYKRENKVQETIDVNSFKSAAGEHNSDPSRREYFRQYYIKNREKARAYQRLYNLKHRKKIDLSCLNIISKREPIRLTYTIHDIAFSTTEKSIKMFNLILNKQRYLSLYSKDGKIHKPGLKNY